MEWYLKAWRSWSDFGGRATRTEYWMFTLFNLIVYALLALLDILAGFGFLDGLYSIAVLIPNAAVAVRRLHDTNRSGWWLLLLLVPFIGLIVLIVFFCQDSGPDNRFGRSPKAEAVSL